MSYSTCHLYSYKNSAVWKNSSTMVFLNKSTNQVVYVAYVSMEPLDLNKEINKCYVYEGIDGATNKNNSSKYKYLGTCIKGTRKHREIMYTLQNGINNENVINEF